MQLLRPPVSPPLRCSLLPLSAVRLAGQEGTLCTRQTLTNQAMPLLQLPVWHV